jgi:hypothetical protein
LASITANVLVISNFDMVLLLENGPKRTLPKAQAFGKVASVPAGQVFTQKQ